jgi:hypothetical protein
MATYYSQGTGNWSTLENWNDVAGGGGSSPASIAAMDDQTFVIQAGHKVTFDVEDAETCDGSISGWITGINGITITSAAEGSTPGELTLSATANNTDRIYGLRLKAGAQIVGTNATVLGKLTAGSNESPIPAAATHVIWALGLHAIATIDLTYLNLAMYGTGPTEPVYVLTADEAISQTELSCEGFRSATNPNTETEWRAGWTVTVCDINKSREFEIYTLAATPVEDGVIHLATGLTKAKSAGALVCLTRRNVELLTTNGGYLFRNGTGAVLDSVSMRSTSGNGAMIGYGTSHTVQGSTVFSNSSDCIQYGTSHTLQGNTVATGCYTVVSVGTSHTVQDNTVICGGSCGIYTGSSHIIQGNVVISGCSTGIGSGTTVINNQLICNDASINGVEKVMQANNKNSSSWWYDVNLTNYTTLVYQPLRNDITAIYATPRTEIWPKGYEPAGTGTDDRKYPTPIPI